MNGNEFRFFLSCDINLPVTFRVEALDGDPPAAPLPGGLVVIPEFWLFMVGQGARFLLLNFMERF